jgi:hypothetical protein
MTEEEATEIFRGMNLIELRELARENNIPDLGFSKEEIIDALNGKCPKCKGGKMKVSYEVRSVNGNIVKQDVPCSTCPQK